MRTTPAEMNWVSVGSLLFPFPFLPIVVFVGIQCVQQRQKIFTATKTGWHPPETSVAAVSAPPQGSRQRYPPRYARRLLTECDQNTETRRGWCPSIDRQQLPRALTGATMRPSPC